jgi:serine protease Do
MRDSSLADVTKATLLAAGLGLCAVAGAAAHDSFAPLIERLRPSVVNIVTTSTVKRTPSSEEGSKSDGQLGVLFGGEFFRDHFSDDLPGLTTQSLGSGFILDGEGYILTNQHVIEGADEIAVRLSDEHEFRARVVGRDPATDLAVIKIEPKGIELRPVELGDSDAVQVGDWVIAIGNPFGYRHSVTAGIVSAKGRVVGAGPYDDFLQTDATILIGNSGGPLFDADGRVVGIANAIVAEGMGIGFAIPVNLAKEVVPQLREKGKVTRGWLGVTVQQLTPDLAEEFGLREPKGALVAEVARGGPADRAGMERGDVILEFDGVPVLTAPRLLRLAAQRAPGTAVTVVLLRLGERRSLEVTLDQLEEEAAPGGAETPQRLDLPRDLGLGVRELTPALRRELGADVERGVVVSKVQPGSPADNAGFQEGDVVLEVNRTAVRDRVSYGNALDQARGRERVLFLVKRGEGSLYLVVPLGK